MDTAPERESLKVRVVTPEGELIELRDVPSPEPMEVINGYTMVDGTPVRVVTPEEARRRERVWRCHACGVRYDDSEDVLTRRVEWRKVGLNGRVVKSRVTGQVCRACLEGDPDFQLPRLRPFADAGWERYPVSDID